jgi:hypothetical protein
VITPSKTLRNPSTMLMWVGKGFRLVPPLPSLLADAPVDVTFRRHSTLRVLTLLPTTQLIRRDGQGQAGSCLPWFDQQRFAFGEHSADESPFLIVELDFQELVSGPQRSRRAVGKQLSGRCSGQPVRGCQNSVFSRQETASALICPDQRKATVPSSA